MIRVATRPIIEWPPYKCFAIFMPIFDIKMCVLCVFFLLSHHLTVIGRSGNIFRFTFMTLEDGGWALFTLGGGVAHDQLYARFYNRGIY